VSSRRVRALQRALTQPAEGVFTDRELEGLPEPVRRMFCALIAPDTPLATSARITMRGGIKLKGWTRFSGTEVIAPHAGFVWVVRAGAITGYDSYLNQQGEMRWKLLGLIPVMHATGLDVSRSAAARAGAEAVWIPTALLPRFGARWQASDEERVSCRLQLDTHELELHLILDEHGRITTCYFDRWGDPDRTGTYAFHPFAMQATAQREFNGLTIPSEGRAGWHYGTDRWQDSTFFEYAITQLEPSRTRVFRRASVFLCRRFTRVGDRRSGS
jgi:hypothetical protein